jgi:deoxyadenosine/deoxycytidine kinase
MEMDYITPNIVIEIISIEGNIGSGKTTLFNLLKSYICENKNPQNNVEYYFVDEPVSEWQSIKDTTQENKDMIQLFYENQYKYSFVFQITAYITRVKKIRELIYTITTEHNKKCDKIGHMLYSTTVLERAPKKHVIIVERSIHVDRNVFAKMLYDDGKINEIEWQSYNYWFDVFSKDYGPNKIIYVKTDPVNSHHRVHKRNRDGENIIPLEYLEKCHNYHEAWINSINTNNNVCYTFDSTRNINSNNTEKSNITFDYIKDVLSMLSFIL